jgi:hypothetical protein
VAGAAPIRARRRRRSPSSTTHQPPTKSEFIREADAICRNFQQKNASLVQQLQDLGQPTSTDELHQDADLIRNYATKVQQEATNLRQLQPPRGDEDVINAWLSTGESGVAAFHDLGDAYDSADVKRIRALGQEGPIPYRQGVRNRAGLRLQGVRSGHLGAGDVAGERGDRAAALPGDGRT